MRRLPLIFLAIQLLLSFKANAQDLFWDYPLQLTDGNAYYYQASTNGRSLVTVWQEFDEQGNISFYSSFSTDGVEWSDGKRIIGPVAYYWENRVSIFSLESSPDGAYYIAIIESESEVGFYRSTDQGESFNRLSGILTDTAPIAPRLKVNKDGRFLLFMSKKVETESGLNPLSLYLSESVDGITWSDPYHFISDADLLYNFLPTYLDLGNQEWVIFQSRYSQSNRTTYQLYLKIRDKVTGEWGEEKLITEIDESYQGDPQPFYYFDNQRPHLSSNNNSVSLAWERRFLTGQPQIYVGNFDSALNLTEVSRISDPNRFNAFPRTFYQDGTRFVTWFDDRQGNQIILGEDKGTFWREFVLSGGDGYSIYGLPLIFKNQSYIFWENRRNDRSYAYVLRPDNTAGVPRLEPVNFRLNVRSNESTVIVSWNIPRDSSGIRGYSYIWDQNPDTVPPQEENRRIPQNRRIYVTADEDGLWYFHLSAVDNAGNWSDPVHLPFIRDTTPPAAVAFELPETDEWGYLASNTFTLSWNDNEEEDFAGYSYTLKYLGTANPDYSGEEIPLEIPPARVLTEERAVYNRNLDNGQWVLTVSALDFTGNISEPSFFVFNLNKYIPVTYISFVTAEKNDQEQIELSIVGRGFSVGGNISAVILDKDQAPPFDYEFSSDMFTVESDRRIKGPVISEILTGDYYVGVIHPRRGMAFSRNQIRLESTGNVKFGNFAYRFKPIWHKAQETLFRLFLNKVIIVTVLILLGLAAAASLIKLIQFARESRIYMADSRALMEGGLLTKDLQEEKIRKMKSRGIGLRIKFISALVSLVIAVVLMVSVSFGYFMISVQSRTLADDLVDRSALLLETLTASAREYLPAKNSISLGVLPNQIESISEARYMTITGIGERDNNQFNYIWGTNDPDINQKQPLPSEISESDFTLLADMTPDQAASFENAYSFTDGTYILQPVTPEDHYLLAALFLDKGLMKPITRGLTPIDDEIEPLSLELQRAIDERANALVGDLNTQKAEVVQQINILSTRGNQDAFDEISALQETIDQIDKAIAENLREIATTEDVYMRSFPEFNPETFITEDRNDYIFFKPIIYTDINSNQYYKGLIRLNITVEFIKEDIRSIQQRIIYFSIAATAIGIVLGLIGALLLSSAMIRPIRKLVIGVEKIRDAEDITRVDDPMIKVKSRDELQQLSDTINQMTKGLIKAAEANKDLIMGKEIQKMFIPLEKDESGNRKLTTGAVETEDAVFFGYYEGAKGVSGDYFDFRQLDDEHFALIKCDISGKGIPASLIMVEVATIFINYFKSHDPKKDGIHTDELVYSINDLITEVGFKGRFAALIVVVFNTKTGQLYMCNAGDNQVHFYNGSTGKMFIKTINEVPAAGVFPNFMLEGDRGYKQVGHKLNAGDIMFLFTDGIEEAQRKFRNRNFQYINCDDSCLAEGMDPENRTHSVNAPFEEFGIPRIQKVVEAVMSRSTYKMQKYHNPISNQELTFDFTKCEGNEKEAVMALIATEKIFRLNPDPGLTAENRIMIDNKIDDFLKDHFDQYREYFRFPVPNNEYPEYTYYTHLQEDEQFDDLTILVLRKK